MNALTDSTESQKQFQDVLQATNQFYSQADQVLTQHSEWVNALAQRRKLEIAFIRLEDTYQWAADLLLQQSSGQRSMRNKAELITSGIARDLKNIRRADAKTDLNELEKVLSKDIEMARKRLDRVLVPDDVKRATSQTSTAYKSSLWAKMVCWQPCVKRSSWKMLCSFKTNRSMPVLPVA